MDLRYTEENCTGMALSGRTRGNGATPWGKMYSGELVTTSGDPVSADGGVVLIKSATRTMMWDRYIYEWVDSTDALPPASCENFSAFDDAIYLSPVVTFTLPDILQSVPYPIRLDLVP